MISVANEIAEAGYAQDGRGSNELLDMAERRVFEIAEKRQKSGSGPKDIASILDATVSRIEELFQRPHDGVTGLDTGFTDLNKKTAGLQRSHHCRRPPIYGEAHVCDESRRKCRSS